MHSTLLCETSSYFEIKVSSGKIIVVPYFFDYKTGVFSFQNNSKDLDPSCKMDLDLWDCLGMGKIGIIARFHRTDLVICSHSRGTKPLSYSRINTVHISPSKWNISGATYNIPICIWLMDTHPYNPPMVFVKPTATMQIKQGRNVDSNGKIDLPYLREWRFVRNVVFLSSATSRNKTWVLLFCQLWRHPCDFLLVF